MQLLFAMIRVPATVLKQLLSRTIYFGGYKEFLVPSDRACYLWFDKSNYYTADIDYNIVFGAKIGVWGLSVNDIDLNPLLMNDNLETFNGHLRSGSPAINSGLAVGSLGGLVPHHDLESTPRPKGKGVDRGAYEYKGSPFIPWTLLLSGNQSGFTP